MKYIYNSSKCQTIVDDIIFEISRDSLSITLKRVLSTAWQPYEPSITISLNKILQLLDFYLFIVR